MNENQEIDNKLMKATFAGGCFWCMQPPFRMLDGVADVVSGYAGGKMENPTYEAVSTGTTGYLESVQVTYDPEKISYETLLDVFWKQIDPTDPQGQFADKGSQYKTAIFYHDDEQKRLAEASKTNLNNSGKFAKSVATEIRPYMNFYPLPRNTTRITIRKIPGGTGSTRSSPAANPSSRRCGADHASSGSIRFQDAPAAVRSRSTSHRSM